jgi:hypothetical protein
MAQPSPAEQRVLRAIEEFKAGKPPSQKCYFCDGVIEVSGGPPGGPYTQFVFTCPCKKSSGFLKGI